MNSDFRVAKNVIRNAVAAAPRATVESILEAAREGRVPWEGDHDIALCGCFSQRISGNAAVFPSDLCEAYAILGWYHALRRDDAHNALRQRILIAILRADLRRRDREMAKALVDSAEAAPALVEAGR